MIHKNSAATARAHIPLSEEVRAILDDIGVGQPMYCDGTLHTKSPISGEVIGRAVEADSGGTLLAIDKAHEAYHVWRNVPAPKRGELIRLLGGERRTHKVARGRLVSIETGKVISEGLGEVQEMIDICDFAVGLSRQLYGLTIATERSDHRMMETWHPLGPVGVITPFNFPVAVWSWNAALALVCGDPVIWKPSDKTPLCALACNAILGRAIARLG